MAEMQSHGAEGMAQRIEGTAKREIRDQGIFL